MAKYAAVNTKVKALERNLLDDEEFDRIIESKNYLDAVRYLKDDTAYNNALSEYNIEDIHRGELEYILKKYYIKNFYKLSHYFSGDYKNLFNILFIRFEVEDLKNIFRGKFIGKDKEEIESLMAYKSPLTQIDYDKLMNAKDIPEVVEALKDTKYYKHLNHVIDSITEEGLFRIETTLDFVYFSSLRKLIKKLNKEDREIMSKFLGIYSDLLNVQWIFRGKKYYKITSEELLNYTIYDGYKLNVNTLKELCYSKDMDEFYRIIGTTNYKNVFAYGKKNEYLVERDILTYLKNLYLQYRKKHENNISVVIAYLELSLLQIRDIVSVIESKRYSISNEEAFRYVTITN